MSESGNSAELIRRLEAGEDSSDLRAALTRRLAQEGLRWAWTDIINKEDDRLGTAVWVGLPEDAGPGDAS